MPKQSIKTIFGYLGNIASILGIIAFGMDYIPRIITATSSSQVELEPIFKLIILVFLSSFSFYLISTGQKNIKDGNRKNNQLRILNFLWIPYALLSILIYIVSAYLYIFSKDSINYSFAEIVIIFISTVVTTYFMIYNIKNNRLYTYYANFFLVGFFLVVFTILYSYFIKNTDKLNFITLISYMTIGVGFYILFSHIGTEKKSKILKDKETRKPYGNK